MIQFKKKDILSFCHLLKPLFGEPFADGRLNYYFISCFIAEISQVEVQQYWDLAQDISAMEQNIKKLYTSFNSTPFRTPWIKFETYHIPQMQEKIDFK